MIVKNKNDYRFDVAHLYEHLFLLHMYVECKLGMGKSTFVTKTNQTMLFKKKTSDLIELMPRLVLNLY